jgi:hypothetical protein
VLAFGSDLPGSGGGLRAEEGATYSRLLFNLLITNVLANEDWNLEGVLGENRGF